MKVLHVINSMATGGAEKLIAQSLPLMETRGIETGLLLLDGTRHPFLDDLQRKYSGPIFQTGAQNVYSPLHIFRLMRVMSRYDIVHVHLFPSVYWAAIAKWLSLSGTKLIFTEHNTHNRRREKKLFKIADRVIYRAYSAITCITEGAREALAAHLGSANKLSVIENGIDLEAIAGAPRISRREIHPSLSDDDKVIVMVAAFRAQKDHATAIRAMQKLPQNVKLVFAGDGNLKSQNIELAESLGLGGRILFLGNRPDVASILKSSTIALLSSHWEGFGLAAVESMAAEIPFVASDVPGLAQVAGGAGLLFEKGNADQLSSVLNKLLSDPDLYRSTAEACSNRAARFDITQMVSQFIALYKNTIR